MLVWGEIWPGEGCHGMAGGDSADKYGWVFTIKDTRTKYITGKKAPLVRGKPKTGV